MSDTTDLEACAGEALREAREHLARRLRDAAFDLEDFEAAWREHDWRWLALRGYLSRDLARDLEQARGDA